MSNLPDLQELAIREPWRVGAGLPRNALDPTWVPSYLDDECPGNVDFDENGWWICMHCGRIGQPGFIRHRPIQHPLAYFLHSAAIYSAVKADTTPSDQLLRETLFVMGAALRQAAAHTIQDYAKMMDSPQ